MLDAASALTRRRQIVRIILIGVIGLTLPFYCIGFFLWGTAPQATRAATETAPATFTPIGGLQGSITPTLTQTIPLFATSTQPLAPTPGQFIPLPTSVPPTAFVFPTSTPAPTLTFAPTSTPIPTNTAVPPTLVPPTNTPAPTSTPVPTLPPTNTEVPPPTATEFILAPPTDTPAP
jgi:hypothetical protein